MADIYKTFFGQFVTRGNEPKQFCSEAVPSHSPLIFSPFKKCLDRKSHHSVHSNIVRIRYESPSQQNVFGTNKSIISANFRNKLRIWYRTKRSQTQILWINRGFDINNDIISANFRNKLRIWYITKRSQTQILWINRGFDINKDIISANFRNKLRIRY
jgi:hypothetical protein